jgi:putative ABC transport system permease protein
MIRSYLKIATRNLVSHKFYSVVNIAGLAIGMAVALLISLWMWDEISFDKFADNYDRVAQIKQNQTFNGEIHTTWALPAPLGPVLKTDFGNNFRYVVMSSRNANHVLTVDSKAISQPGSFMEPDAPELLQLKMLEGTRGDLKDPYSILLSQSVSKAIFGDASPIGKRVNVDNHSGFKVTGVYKNFPNNSSFRDLSFIAPWDYYIQNVMRKGFSTNWGINLFQIFVQIADNTDMAALSAKIKEAKLRNLNQDEAKNKAALFLYPMSRWHLFSEFKNGINTGGLIQYVWLFSIVGLFVLLLACINFMNLSTARSEKRAKEVGIRKAVGSLRGQLIRQFLSESILTSAIAFVFAQLMSILMLPYFNEFANKQVSIPWSNPYYWILSIGFTLLTGLTAGSYPAFYLSSFNPVKSLKGTFKAGPLAAIPRQFLVVLQFTFSVILIIGTIIVFKQIQYARNRPVGYEREGLITITTTTNDLHDHFASFRNDLISSGSVIEAAESNSPTTNVESNSNGFSWKGKDPAMMDDIAVIGVTDGYGKTVGWQFLEGRNFSKQFLTDSSAIILNEAAVKYMGLNKPVGEDIVWGNYYTHVIGVIKDMIMQSPYEPVKQSIFYLSNRPSGYINIKISPDISVAVALAKIESVYKVYCLSIPFAYKFADEEYAKKFIDEVRVGKLAGFFAGLAIFISCLGLFGMAAFMAEQRTREIGIRKVLGASVLNLWNLLTKGFVKLILISLMISIPFSYYLMDKWLMHYQYHTDIPWWVFAVSAGGALLITILTISFLSIRAATMNPVKSLRSE